MWSFIGPLIKENPNKASAYRNVERHNGLEAWRVMSEPINEEKSLARKDLLPLINNPKGAATIDDLEPKLLEWNTNIRKMIENGGNAPDDATRRAAFLEMLPAELNTHATMKLDEPEFATFGQVKAWATKYVKVLQKQKRRTKGGLHVVDRGADERGQDEEEEWHSAEEGQMNDDDDWAAQQAEVLATLRDAKQRLVRILRCKCWPL